MRGGRGTAGRFQVSCVSMPGAKDKGAKGEKGGRGEAYRNHALGVVNIVGGRGVGREEGLERRLVRLGVHAPHEDEAPGRVRRVRVERRRQRRRLVLFPFGLGISCPSRARGAFLARVGCCQGFALMLTSTFEWGRRGGGGRGVLAGDLVDEPLAVLEILVLEGVPARLGERAEAEFDGLFFRRGLPLLLPLSFPIFLVPFLRLTSLFAFLFARYGYRYGGAPGEPGPGGGEVRGVRCGRAGDKCEAFAFGWGAGAVEVVRWEGHCLYPYLAWWGCTCARGRGRGAGGGNGKQGREEAVDPRDGAVRDGHVFLRMQYTCHCQEGCCCLCEGSGNGGRCVPRRRYGPPTRFARSCGHAPARRRCV